MRLPGGTRIGLTENGHVAVRPTELGVVSATVVFGSRKALSVVGRVGHRGATGGMVGGPVRLLIARRRRGPGVRRVVGGMVGGMVG